MAVDLAHILSAHTKSMASQVQFTGKVLIKILLYCKS